MRVGGAAQAPPITAVITTGFERDAAFLEVTTAGPVLAPQEVPALFEPFHQGRERGSGFGLGLAVVQAITTTHRGEVTATPRAGEGLTVRVVLPARSGGAAPSP